MPGARRDFSAIEVGVVLVLVVLLGLFLLPVGARRQALAQRTACANNLRHLGLAAIQYSDDKRWFPHVSRPSQLDAGFATAGPTTTAKSFRALLWYGYQDDTQTWLCPSSLDTYRPSASTSSHGDPRRWFWGGGQAPATERSPFVDGLADPAIAESTELSYGWTRKGHGRGGARSVDALAADRAVREPNAEASALRPGEVGNHGDGWNVVFCGGDVLWWEPGSDVSQFMTFRAANASPLDPAHLLTTTGGATSGWLAILDQSQSLGGGS